MGSLVKCVGCGQRCGSKPIGVYWRWMRADGAWKKYYARLCAGCYAAKVLAVDNEYSADARLTCPACGLDTEDDYDAVYLTHFPPKAAQQDTDAPFCGACAAQYRVWVVDHARDTELLEGAPEPPRGSGGPAAAGSTVMRDLGRR